MASKRPYLVCEEVVALATDALEDALPRRAWFHFQMHLGACSGCRAFMAQLRAAVQGAPTLSPPSPDDAQVSQALEQFRVWKAKKS